MDLHVISEKFNMHGKCQYLIAILLHVDLSLLRLAFVQIMLALPATLSQLVTLMPLLLLLCTFFHFEIVLHLTFSARPCDL